MNKVYTSPLESVKLIIMIIVRFLTLLPISVGALVVGFFTGTLRTDHKLTKFKIRRIKFFYRCKLWVYRHMLWFCRLTNTEDYFQYYDRYGMQLSHKPTDK